MAKGKNLLNYAQSQGFDSIRAFVRARIKEGYSPFTIAKEAGVVHNTVYVVVRELRGVKTPKGWVIPDEESPMEIIEQQRAKMKARRQAEHES